jgi:phosphate-selective porin OprO/OprP
MYERLDAKIEFDFAGGSANLRDAWIEALKLPYVGTFRVGHFKEPLSLEQMMSANYTTFIERSLMDAFAPGRNTGFGIFNAPFEQRMTWALGTFRQTNNNTGNGFSDQATYNITGRLTGLPWYENEGEHLLHVGLGASQRFLDGADVQYQSIPEVSLNDPSYVNTQPIPADSAQILTPELALVYGPFSFQTEYTHAWTQGADDTQNTDFWGVYAYVSWFLTGEHRPYKTAEGVFDRVYPEHNFDFHGGLGAWEIAARYSHIDLDDAFVEGGKLNDGTLGVNWYLNPNFRWSLNYVYADLNDVGNANQVVARFWVNF